MKICVIILLFVAFFCQGACIIVAGYTTNWLVAVVCLTLAVGGGGFAFSGFFVNHLDIAPPFAGILMGISNAVATLPGIISPLLTGVIVQHQVCDRSLFAALETRKKLDRLNFRKDFWEVTGTRRSAIGQFLPLSPETVPEVLAKVNWVQFPSRFESGVLHIGSVNSTINPFHQHKHHY